jgi:hypothetical protein
MTTVESIVAELVHYGVKGMKWGVRRSAPAAGVTVTERPGRKVKTGGGTGQRPSEDAVRAAVARQKARKSTTDALSNRELQDLVNRMNLEQQYSRLAPKTPTQQVSRFIGETLLGIGKDQASRLARDAAAQQIGKILKK